jgi:hypothetical protein
VRFFRRRKYADEDDDAAPAKSRRWRLCFIREDKWVGYFKGPKTGVRYIGILPMVILVIDPKPCPPIPPIPEGVLRGWRD